jgi:NAD(P)-dependent dehydrogenase (short-subunit alcohol dehydrogenase family)
MQGYELQLGIHCLGHFLFTQCLRPALVKTAKLSLASSVRVVWISSLAIENYASEGGMNLDRLNYFEQTSQWECYAQSKVGCIFLASELARQAREKGIISVVSPYNCQVIQDRPTADFPV